MGTVFKKSVTRNLPDGATVTSRRRRATLRELRKNPDQATVVEQIAKWRDRKGDWQTGVVIIRGDGTQRVRTMSATYYAKFRDGDELVQVLPTGCRDLQAAKSKLADLEKTAEKIRAGSITTMDVKVGDHNRTPLDVHISEYVEYLRKGRKNADRIKTTETRLKEIARVCHFERLRDMNADALTSWLATEAGTGRSAAVLNGFVEVAVSFGYWLTGKRIRGRKSHQLGEIRLPRNPFAGLGRFDIRADRRRQRRALSEPELQRLLFTARWRPLAEYGRESEPVDVKNMPTDSRSRKTWTLKPLEYQDIPAAVEAGRRCLEDNPEFVAELDRRGLERTLIYKVAVLTGLQRGEIEALTIGHLDLNPTCPLIRLGPTETKNRETAEVPLHSGLAEDLRMWLRLKQEPIATDSDVLPLHSVDPILDRTEPVFNVPKQLVKSLDRDLAAAGIEKKDDRGRTIDFHALRHSFGTLLSTSGVAPRTAQQAMRHSDIALTMNVYTDPRLLDVAGAMESLPQLPISDSLDLPGTQILRATGTENVNSSVAPMVAPGAVVLVQQESIPDNSTGTGAKIDLAKNIEKFGLKPRFSKSGREDSNLRPLRPERSALPG